MGTSEPHPPGARPATPPGGAAAELRDALTPRAVLLVLAVLALHLAFVLSYAGAFHAPTPQRVPVAVVAPPGQADQLAEQLDDLPGQPLRAHVVDDEAAAVARLERREVDAAIVANPDSDTDTVLVASAAGASVGEAVRGVLTPVQQERGRQLQTRDVVPAASGDARGLTPFYLVIGWMLGGYLASAIMGLAGGEHRARPARVGVRLAVLAGYAVLSGLGGALIVGPVLDALPSGNVLVLWWVGALVAFASGATTMALQVLFGVVGVGVAILAFVVLGNPSAGGAYDASLLPPFWRAVGPWLPPGAGTTLVRDTAYFGDAPIAGPVGVLSGYAVLGVAVALIAAALLSRRPRRTGTTPAGIGATGNPR
ncbi:MULTISPECIES: membrane protein [Actinoalloteichus]|uniref:membrane protein n=1 Tax=Actinoalloteichus TaxID=65496 RepID=UPI0003FCA56F|nr:membrane protein [Actinoalloteichus caeruleus]